MYVNPVLVGIVGTIFVEILILLAIAGMAAFKIKKGKK